ncbi:MAG: hypothetical protein CVU73_14525 [Deltaproteobacteria bacterium HGW-Deltaproteobacteria-8]|nr:MAG: hypothetical protein CVU73_14525 [Deltaproteobacteria bacterium HGW-Deltaproteobacteria-8]
MFDEKEFLLRYEVTPGLPINKDNLVAYAQRHDVQPASENYLWAFLGDSSPSSSHRLYMRDHEDLWLKYYVPCSFTIQPYAAAVNWPRAHKEWSDFAQQHGLRYRILPAGSGWYNPQRTVCVEFTFDYEIRWDLPFFFDEVVDMREHPERYKQSC